MASRFSAIDLFSGAGGFSLGMQRAGFRIVSAVDLDPQAACTYGRNFPEHYFFERNLWDFTAADMQDEIGRDPVDVIFGGPPCQGFSGFRVGNHGERIVRDERRELYRPFLEYVAEFKPKVFVMENVPGVRTAVNGEIFGEILREIRAHGYTPHWELLRAWRFGIPQKRVRLIIAGFRRDMPPVPDGVFVSPTHADKPGDNSGLPDPVTLWKAIGDLPRLKAGETVSEYDVRQRTDFAIKHGDEYIDKIAEVYGTLELTGHSARPHMDRDLRDFARLRQGESSVSAVRRGEKMEFPDERGEKFKDRYTRQHKNRLSSTIVAHLSKDGLMFIHPTQRRSFTAREAARIQSFPDWFQFPVARTHQFRLIGNAVPPLMGLILLKLRWSYDTIRR